MRKRKMNFWILAEMLDCIVGERRLKKHDGTKGWVYKLDRRLDDEERNIIMGYDNTDIGYIVSEYAPELRYNAVILYDKCIRKGV